MLIKLLYYFVFFVFCAANGLVKFVSKPALITVITCQKSHLVRAKGIHSSDLVAKRVESQLSSASQTSLILDSMRQQNLK
jgi:hypothetical protein